MSIMKREDLKERKNKMNGFRIQRPVANPEWFHPADTQVTV
jgi:hypothetical protein